MEKSGNEQARNYFEGSLPVDFIRPSHKNLKELKKFIHEKYILLRYIPVGPNNQILSPPPSHLTQILASSSSSQIISPTASNSDEIYICERSGDVDREVDEFIKQIGENRKITPKDVIGPLYQQEELKKQSEKMKRQFELEDRKKKDQYIRGMIAMNEICTKRKQMNELNNQKVKIKIEEENKRQDETKQLKFEEKSQKLSEMENRRVEKKKELRLKNKN